MVCLVADNGVSQAWLRILQEGFSESSDARAGKDIGSHPAKLSHVPENTVEALREMTCQRSMVSYSRTRN